jgi:valyl-tRNA synthetase
VAQLLAYALERIMRLLHPFMPFATEAMWQALPHSGESVMVAPWPEPGERDPEAERQWNLIEDLVTKIRNARAETGVEAGKWLPASVHAGEHQSSFAHASRELSVLARLSLDHLTFSSDPSDPEDGDIVVVAGDVVAVLPLAGSVDIGEERERLTRELEAARLKQSRASAQLSNESFVERAPKQVVDVQRQRLATADEAIAVISARLADIGS